MAWFLSIVGVSKEFFRKSHLIKLEQSKYRNMYLIAGPKSVDKKDCILFESPENMSILQHLPIYSR